MTEIPASPDGSLPGRPAAHGLVPLWTFALGWELRRGRQVILHGGVNDRYWMRGQPIGFRDLLINYLLVTAKADIIGWWDPVDGLDFPVPGHEARFQDVYGQARPAGTAAQDSSPGGAPGNGAAAGTSTTIGTSTAAGGSAAPGAGPPDPPASAETSRAAALRASTQRLGAPRAPSGFRAIEDALAAIRRVVSSPAAISAFVLHDIDAVLPPGDPGSAANYLRLRAAMRDAVVPDSPAGKPPYARNAVIVATGALSRLPDWLYQEDPRVVALHLARPDAAERRLWLSMLRAEFTGAAGEADLEPLVGPTEGLAGWQLDALARTSAIRNVPVQKVTKLLDAYRYNVRTNPWTQLDPRLIRDSGRLLAQRVIGQDRAVDAVASALQAAYIGVNFGASGAARPRGVFFFVGPTGVGKTELAKAVAELTFGDESAYARFDMSEYQQQHAAERLAGAPPGFVGFEQGGELTTRVQEHPFSVLLFDEIEKAHPAVLDKFLQILEDGRLTDGRGQTAYFSQCLIIFTSNTGADGVPGMLSSAALASPAELPYTELERHFTAAVEEKFRSLGRPEIFGRLRPGVVVFDMLRPQHVAGITSRLADQLVESVWERHHVELVIDRASVQAWMAERMAAPERFAYGGRQIRNEMEELRRAVVHYFVAAEPAAGSQVQLGVGPAGEIVVSPGAPETPRPGEPVTPG